jgi:hypothetical protein
MTLREEVLRRRVKKERMLSELEFSETQWPCKHLQSFVSSSVVSATEGQRKERKWIRTIKV